MRYTTTAITSQAIQQAVTQLLSPSVQVELKRAMARHLLVLSGGIAFGYSEKDGRLMIAD